MTTTNLDRAHAHAALRPLAGAALALALAACGSATVSPAGGAPPETPWTPGPTGEVTGCTPTTTFALPPTITGTVAASMQTGNALCGATADDFLDATVATIEYQRTLGDPIVAALYGLNADGTAKTDGTSLTAVSWDARWDSSLLAGTFGVNKEVIVTNQDKSGAAAPARALAVAGVAAQGGRYLVLAGDPFRTGSLDNASVVNAQLDQLMVNAVRWLTGKADGAAKKVALLQLDDSYYFKDESSTRAWLTARYGSAVTMNAADAYDGANAGKILTDGADLVIVSQYLAAGQDAAQVRDAVEALLDAGVPVLYVHHDGNLTDLGALLFDLFQVRYLDDNTWIRYRAASLDGRTLFGQLPAELASIREMATRLRSGAYSFDLTQVATVGESLASFKAEFLDGAQGARAQLRALDQAGTDAFLAGGREVTKLLALTADRIRQDVVFPLKVASTPTRDFLRSYFADHAVYNARRIAPAQKDLGTFSRTDFTGVVQTTRVVAMTSRPSFRATGAYALPGRTFKVTRLDDGAVKTSIFVNSLRSGSTQLWKDSSFGGYARPKFLWSTSVPVAPGETVTFTSAHGGPIEIAFDVKDVPVRLSFEGVAEHPYWSGPADDADFAAKLAAAKFDWVEVATDGFEVHSKADRFVTQTLANPNWSAPQLLSAATMRYTYGASHVLAGFQGDGIPQEPEVHGWAAARGLPIPSTDVVKHMNADVPSCGWGCSGNPYDAGWAFSPIGHGDVHELAHSLQSGRWQLTVGGRQYPNHSGTNFYAFYAQSCAYDAQGALDDGQHGMPFKPIFQQLQAARAAGDRAGSVSTTMETYLSDALAPGGDAGYSNSYVFYFQLMMQARQRGLLQNGWHVMGRLHAVVRAFDAAKGSQAAWDAAKGGFGFGQVAYADAQAMSNNDFMAIAMSFTSGLDVRDYMAMWGFRISPFASAQIAALGLPAAERVYFAVGQMDWVKGALTNRVGEFPRVVIDGTSAWPLDSTASTSGAAFQVR